MKLPFPSKPKKQQKTEYTAEEYQSLLTLKGDCIQEKDEDDEQLELCLWLHKTYPNALFCSDIAGRFLPKTVRNRVYKMRSKESKTETVKFPDLLIYDHSLKYNGLALEIKKTGFKLFKVDGTLIKDEHIEKQQKTLERFKSLGWAACFGVGLESCKTIITNYFTNQPF